MGRPVADLSVSALLDGVGAGDAFGTVANLMNSGHVETVFIAGKVKKWRGDLVGTDMNRVRQLVRESQQAVMQRENFNVDLLAAG